jgi:hypothetical protein
MLNVLKKILGHFLRGGICQKKWRGKICLKGEKIYGKPV